VSALIFGIFVDATPVVRNNGISEDMVNFGSKLCFLRVGVGVDCHGAVKLTLGGDVRRSSHNFAAFGGVDDLKANDDSKTEIVSKMGDVGDVEYKYSHVGDYSCEAGIV
jgi:hypothetical protein